jgi:gamma-glutamylcyclotransferase (GGCT)/AIG2-like uncharacterized protein YtfP
MTILFVYGTLMRGGRYHDLLANARFCGEACTPPCFELVALGEYPALVSGEKRVSGELFQVDDDTLAAIDELEGHPELYERRSILLEGGVEAHAYLLPRGR